MTAVWFFSSCSLAKRWHLALCSHTSHLFQFQLLGGKPQSFERKSGLCEEGPAGFELSEGKARLLGTAGSPVSIIPYLEKLDLQSKSIF